MNRVVITGMGIWSCIGTSLDEVRDSLYVGKSGIILDPIRKEAGFRSGLVGNVPKADLKTLLPRNTRSYMHEECQYAYMATLQALKQAGIDMDYLEQHEVGIVYGNDSAVEASSKTIDKFHQMHTSLACGSGSLFQCLNSTISMNLACIFKLKGINQTISAACSSGSQSIGMAATLIANGLQDCIICGGAEETNHLGVVSFDGLLRGPDEKQSKSFLIHAKNEFVNEMADNKINNQAIPFIRDYDLNMGYYDSYKDGRIKITLSNKGTYHYEDLRVSAMDASLFDKYEGQLSADRLQIESCGDEEVNGTVSCKRPGVLFLSISDYHNWKIYIDGERADRIDDLNIAFTGLMVPAGDHSIKLVYVNRNLRAGSRVLKHR